MIKGTSLLLTRVGEKEDGLELQCRIYPHTMGTIINTESTPQVYKFKIDVLPTGFVTKSSKRPPSTRPTRETKGSSWLEIAISLNFDEDSVRLIRLYTMSSPRRSFKPTLINHIFYLLWFPIVTRVDTSLEICSEEEIEFYCPSRDQAIKSNQYQSLLWSVFDPMNPSAKRENIFYCGQNPVNCHTYKLSSYDGRISVRSPVPGKLFLKHLTKNDLLTYTCQIQLKDINLDRLVYRVNISSSVYCLTARIGKNLSLTPQEFAEKRLSKTLFDEDIWWSMIEDNGKKCTFLYCNATSYCTFSNDPCYQSRPQFSKRLELKGLSLILTDVRQGDRGLVFQRRIHPNSLMKRRDKPWHELYTVKIQNIPAPLTRKVLLQMIAVQHIHRHPQLVVAKSPALLSLYWLVF
ncbi:unnamed protein product [Porites evermanni]|uniref:Ig-like domain-containing protein n=1 Tax=Porites evermanni TaxID=104178 RepID=A0ABN8SNS2_9CNID|nr:unnamed protein product [Porites evermanni]